MLRPPVMNVVSPSKVVSSLSKETRGVSIRNASDAMHVEQRSRRSRSAQNRITSELSDSIASVEEQRARS